MRLLSIMVPMTIMKQRLAMVMTAIYLFWSPDASAQYREEIPFVPTPIEVVDKMLELAAIAKGDVLYDLGSGDGRIVIRAAKKYGVRAVGLEADPILIAKARAAAKAEGVSHLAEFRAEAEMEDCSALAGAAAVRCTVRNTARGPAAAALAAAMTSRYRGRLLRTLIVPPPFSFEVGGRRMTLRLTPTRASASGGNLMLHGKADLE